MCADSDKRGRGGSGERSNRVLLRRAAARGPRGCGFRERKLARRRPRCGDTELDAWLGNFALSTATVLGAHLRVKVHFLAAGVRRSAELCGHMTPITAAQGVTSTPFHVLRLYLSSTSRDNGSTWRPVSFHTSRTSFKQSTHTIATRCNHRFISIHLEQVSPHLQPSGVRTGGQISVITGYLVNMQELC